MKMFETHENEIGQKVSKHIGKLELRMAGGLIVSSGKRYFPIRWPTDATECLLHRNSSRLVLRV
jgi:hypothetical protein